MKRFRCPGCKDLQEYDESLAGQVFECTNCGKKVRLPAAAAPAKSAAIQKDRDEEEDEEERKPARPAAKRKPVADDEEEEERISTRPAAKRKAVEEDDEPYPDDDDEEEEQEVRPRRRRIKKKRRRPPSNDGGVIKLPGGIKLSPFALTLVVIGGGSLVLMMIGFVFSFVFPPVAAVLTLVLGGVAFLLMIVGSLWLLVIAFQEDTLQGILCLFVPLYSIFFLVTHFEDCKQAFFVYLLGFALMFFAGCPMACAGGGGGPDLGPPPPNFAPPPPPFPRR